MTSILDRAKADWKKLSQEVDLTFTPPVGDAVTVKGIGIKHHLSFSTQGEVMSAKNTHCSVSEALLTDEDYPVRDSKGNVNMKKHRVSFKDSNDVEKTYSINECYPDESIGVICFILGVYE